jgi:hypothetical protein
MLAVLEPFLVLVALLAVLQRAPGLVGRSRALGWAIALMVIAVELRSYALLFRTFDAASFEWDFLCFWTWGHMGAHGVDFYDTVAAAPYAAGHSAEFVDDIIRTGFWYPPPSMLVFAGLGFATPPTALVVWLAVLGACTVGSAVVLWSLFAAKSGRLGLAACVAFLLALPSTKHSFSFAQTHPLALLLSLLVLRFGGRARAGVFAVLAAVVKPYLAFWFVYLALARRGRALAGAGVAAAVVVALTSVSFGARRFVEYFVENPVSRAPASVHSEGVNHSSFAVFLRATGSEALAHEPRGMLLGAVIAAAVFLPAVAAAWAHRRSDPIRAGTLLLAASLVAFPSTLTHYAMMTAPLLLFLCSRARSPRASIAALFAVAALASLPGYHSGSLVFWLHVTLFAWLLLEALLPARSPSAVSRPSSATNLSLPTNPRATPHLPAP